VTAPTARPRTLPPLAITGIAACAVTIGCILALVLTGYEPPLSGLTVVGVPVLCGIAGWIARGPRWQS
jgi:hypothetical protein